MSTFPAAPRRNAAVWRVACHPELVYWAQPLHPSFWPENHPPPDGALLRLRDGTNLEAGLPPAEMCVFVAWLRQANASARWGAWDASDTPPATD